MMPGMPAAPSGSGSSHLRQAMAVGRHRAQRRGLGGAGRVQIDAVEIIARLFGRDRELGLVDQPLEVGGRQRERMAHLAGGEIGEIAFRQGLQGEARAPGADREHGAVAGAFDHDLRALGQLAHDVVEHVRRHGGGCLPAKLRRRSQSVTSRSRSVAFRLSLPLSALTSTLARIGMVLRRSTTRWTWPSDLKSSARSTVTFMGRPAPAPLQWSLKSGARQAGGSRMRGRGAKVTAPARNRKGADARANPGSTGGPIVMPAASPPHRSGG